MKKIGPLFVLISFMEIAANVLAACSTGQVEPLVVTPVPAHCSGNANGVLDITADGHLTYVQNTSNRVVHTKFTNYFATFPIDLGPGEKKPIAVNGQGITFSSCEANF